MPFGLRLAALALPLQNGESLTYVKEQMGHSSINVTVDIYGQLVSGGNRQAVDKLDVRLPVPAQKTAQKQGLEQKVATTVKKIRLFGV